MASRAFIPSLLCLVAAARLAGAPAMPAPTPTTPDKINGLLNNSPFGQSRGGVAAGGVNSNDPLEFRAVLEDKGGTMFSIYDTASHRSMWVQLKDSSNGFAVNEYDAAKESVTVDYHGRPMTLAIKRAPNVVQAAGSRPNLPGAQAGPGGIMPSNMPVATMPGSVDQQRMQQIQEEIRRRRALREQSSGSNNAPTSQTGPVAQPAVNSTGPVATPSTSTGPQPIPSKP